MIDKLRCYRFENHLQFWRSHYCLDAHINFEAYSQEDFGYIDYLLLSPPFHNHARFFLGEVMRLSYFNCLLYSQHRYVEIVNNLLIF